MLGEECVGDQRFLPFLEVFQCPAVRGSDLPLFGTDGRIPGKPSYIC